MQSRGGSELGTPDPLLETEATAGGNHRVGALENRKRKFAMLRRIRDRFFETLG